MNVKDLLYARRAKKAGANYSLRIIMEARRAGIPLSLAFALIEQESNFQNVFGHDPTIFQGAGKVTKSKYQAYHRARGRTRMQGVGPAQLTWWGFQDAADAAGGCWIPKHNIQIGLFHLASLIRTYGYTKGIRRYNGSGDPAVKYADSVASKQNKWHRILLGGK